MTDPTTNPTTTTDHTTSLTIGPAGNRHDPSRHEAHRYRSCPV
jgi:hypothetical protein